MQPSNHTKLMNCLIGMCKKSDKWVTLLADLGYEVRLIEQKINTSSGDVVKPDIVAVSNRYLHSLVFECKGGTTIDSDQLKRYSTLTNDNISRWVGPHVFDPINLRLDVCLSDLEENHGVVKTYNKVFPMLTFGFENKKMFKTRNFKNAELNNKLIRPMNLKDKVPPLFYYPFSEDDPDPYIAFHVIATIISVAIKNYKEGGPDVFEDKIIGFDEVVASRFNYVWDALSDEHRGRLKTKIKEVIRRLMAKENLKNELGLLQQKKGFKIAQPLKRFKKGAQQFLDQLETQKPLSEFLDFPEK